MTSFSLRMIAGAFALSLWLGPLAPSASAQTLCGPGLMACAAGQDCIMPPDGMGRGVCMDRMCLALIPTDARMFCFAARPGAPLEERFHHGDCDGDLIINGEEIDGHLCDGGVVATLSTVGNFGWRTGQRLDQPLAFNNIAPLDATSGVEDAIGIGCTLDRDCPLLPSNPALPSRCVFFRTDADTSEVRGVCTYAYDDRDDESCLDARVDSACLDSTVADADPHYVWEHGDCDRDGLINKLDPRVCSGISVVAETDAGPRCAPGLIEAMCRTSLVEIAPSLNGCMSAVSGGADITPFGVCCATGRDCPVLDFGTGDVGTGRCVLFGGDATSAGGVCTYSTGFDGDDTSCVGDDPARLEHCFTDDDAYRSWAEGDCNLCGEDNADDVSVCGVCPIEPEPDASVGPGDDAGLGPNTDAGSNLMNDAGSSAQLDANVGPNLDGGPAIDAGAPGVFSGTGCSCRTQRRETSALALAFAAAIGLAAGVRRRARHRR